MAMTSVTAQVTGSSIKLAVVDFLTTNVFVNGHDTGSTMVALKPSGATSSAEFSVDVSDGSHLVVDIQGFPGTAWAFSLTNKATSKVICPLSDTLQSNFESLPGIVKM